MNERVLKKLQTFLTPSYREWFVPVGRKGQRSAFCSFLWNEKDKKGRRFFIKSGGKKFKGRGFFEKKPPKKLPGIAVTSTYSVTDIYAIGVEVQRSTAQTSLPFQIQKSISP